MFKRNLMKSFMLLFFVFLFAYPLRAQELQILTEQDPPYSFKGPDGKPTGYGVDVVSEIQKRVGNKNQIEIIPWARAYFKIQKEPNVVVFTMTKTKERDPLFQWVGPVIENGWVFVTKKGSGVKITSLEDAKKLTSIGVVRDYAWDNHLISQGFTNLERVAEGAQNVKKTSLGRIQAFVSSDLSYRHEIVEAGLNPDDFEAQLTFEVVQMYIAHSKINDKTIVDSWQSAFDAMKSDGTLAVILKKYLPGANLPGPARAPDF